jgi:hypothetical protein
VNYAEEFERRPRSRFWSLSSPHRLAEWIEGDLDHLAPASDLPGAGPESVTDSDDDPLRPFALSVIGGFIRSGVPSAGPTAGEHWLVTQFGSPGKRLARLTVGMSEVMIVAWGDDYAEFTFRVARSPIDRAIAAGDLTDVDFTKRGIWYGPDGLRIQSEDALRIRCPHPEAAFWLLDQPAVVEAARLMTARLCVDGRFPYRKDYRPELAAECWALVDHADMIIPPDTEPRHDELAFDRPYSGASAVSDYPDTQSIDAAAHERARLEHDRLCRLLIAHLRAAGIESGERTGVPVDLAWTSLEDRTMIAEVKSSLGGHDRTQLRLGLGQVLEYRHRLSAEGVLADAVLLVSTVRDPVWYAICADANVLLLAADREYDWRITT